jgi:periplasmic protein TonB
MKLQKTLITLFAFFLLFSVGENVFATDNASSANAIKKITMPSYKEGKAGLESYISSQVHYSERAKKMGISGVVFVDFTVEANGSITNVKLANSLFSDLDNEALRVVSNMPAWNPGMQGEQAVPVSMRLPIAFSIK